MRTPLTFAGGAIVGALTAAMLTTLAGERPNPPRPPPASSAERLPPPRPPAMPDPPPGPVTEPAPATSDTPPPSDPACEATLAERDVELQLLRGQLETFTGVSEAWPEALPAALRPDILPGRLEAAMAPYAETVGIDCSEYPCLAALLVHPSIAEGKKRSQLLRVLQKAHTAAGLPLYPHNTISMEGGTYVVTVYADVETAPLPSVRFTYRADNMFSEVSTHHAQRIEAP